MAQKIIWRTNLPYDDALLAFRVRAGVQRNIRTHYKNDEENSREGWACWENCNAVDTNPHILHQCPKYDSFKKNLDFSRDEDVVLFFRQVLEKREKDREENLHIK